MYIVYRDFWTSLIKFRYGLPFKMEKRKGIIVPVNSNSYIYFEFLTRLA